MSKGASARSNKNGVDSLQLAKDFEENTDVRRVRLPVDKLKDQFKLSFPERYMDRLDFNNSETFDKRIAQYQLSYAGSQSTRSSSTRQSQVQLQRTLSSSIANSRPASSKHGSKSNTPTAKSNRKSPGKNKDLKKSSNRSSSKIKDTDRPQVGTSTTVLSPSKVKDTGSNRLSISQSPQRQEGLTPPASKQPSRQSSPKPHNIVLPSAAPILPPTNSYMAYKASLMSSASTSRATNTRRPSSARSNYNSLEYKQNLLLDHENDMHERALKITNNHVVLDTLATNLATEYVESNIKDHKVFRNRYEVWEAHKDYVKPWRHNMKHDELEDINNVEMRIKKKITINEPMKANTIDVEQDLYQELEKPTTDKSRADPQRHHISAELLQKYGKNDSQQLYDESEEKSSLPSMEKRSDDERFIKRYSIQNIQWNRQYASIASYKQDLENTAQQEGVTGLFKPSLDRSPQGNQKAASLLSNSNIAMQLERYRVSPNAIRQDDAKYKIATSGFKTIKSPISNKRLVRPPSASSAKGKQSAKTGMTIRASSSRNFPQSQLIPALNEKEGSIGQPQQQKKRSSNAFLKTSAPEVDIGKSISSTKVDQSSLVLIKDQPDIERNSTSSASASSPTKVTTPRRPSPLASPERSPEIKEYTSHAQVYKAPTMNNIPVLQKKVDPIRTISPIMFPESIDTTPRIRKSYIKPVQEEVHERVLNELSSDLRDLVNNKKNKARRLPASIADPHEIFPLSPLETKGSLKDVSVDLLSRSPLQAINLTPNRIKMTDESSRNITKLYINTASSPHAPINSSMLRESKGLQAYIAPEQPLAIHDSFAEQSILAKSQELAENQERSKFLSSALQQTLSKKLEATTPINETLQMQLYNALTKKINSTESET